MTDAETDSEIKIIRHFPSRIDIADDPSLAFRVEVNLRPPEFMNVAFVMLYGGSEEIAEGWSISDLDLDRGVP